MRFESYLWAVLALLLAGSAVWEDGTTLQPLQGVSGAPAPGEPVGYATLRSWPHSVGAVLGGTFRDARIRPYGNMSAEEVARWTSADKS